VLTVRKARADEMHTCFALRYEVFVLGQGVPPQLEVDGHDGLCVHILALWKDEAVGTARLRTTPEGSAKAERVGVRGGFQGRGIGTALMALLEDLARKRGDAEIRLNAQERVVPFYETLGYIGYGEPFMEACIRHVKMKKPLHA
jgi:predicted GNAT family N-acyltransferase